MGLRAARASERWLSADRFGSACAHGWCHDDSECKSPGYLVTDRQAGTKAVTRRDDRDHCYRHGPVNGNFEVHTLQPPAA